MSVTDFTDFNYIYTVTGFTEAMHNSSTETLPGN